MIAAKVSYLNREDILGKRSASKGLVCFIEGLKICISYPTLYSETPGKTLLFA